MACVGYSLAPAKRASVPASMLASSGWYTPSITPGSMPEYATSSSGVTRVRRTPGIGRMPKRRSTATWGVAAACQDHVPLHGGVSSQEGKHFFF